MLKRHGLILAAFFSLSIPAAFGASVGTNGAGFLEIPVGGRPAAMGGSYSTLALDAYAPVWNPAGLGFLYTTEFAAMHLNYADSIGYEYASLAQPLGGGDVMSAAIQYFHPKEMIARDLSGNETGRFQSYYAAYSMAYGRSFGGAYSLGATIKLLDARISDIRASAIGMDFGALYRVSNQWRLAGVISNIGEKMKFIEQEDPLPLIYRVGMLFSPAAILNLTAEGSVDSSKTVAGRVGTEWRPVSGLALRLGYRTDTSRELSKSRPSSSPVALVAGITTGVGFELFGQRFDYAWLPLGQLGYTQYFSVAITFGSPTVNKEEAEDTYIYQ